MPFKVKKIRSIYILYWILLAYIIAALVWWFIALKRQNVQMAEIKMEQLNTLHPSHNQSLQQINDYAKRKTAQYIGEGVTFFLLIVAGAIFVFRVIRNQLRQSQQQQNFMMALTHELKTPIAVAQLNLETLQKRKLDAQQQQRIIETALQETNRLNSLCNNMLLSSQIDAKGLNINLEEINFSDLVHICMQECTARYPLRTIEVKIEENIYVSGDQLLLQMAVNNLLDNAIKYSNKETEIFIELNKNCEQANFRVMDNGIGISDEEKANIFSKFYRVGNAATKLAKGTGLGLYITQKIVEQHYGKVTVIDNLPLGSIFTITLPIN